MKKTTFPDGGFVIHGIAHLTQNRISAWFNAKGDPVDAQYMPSGRSVIQRGSVWLSLQSMGRAWRI